MRRRWILQTWTEEGSNHWRMFRPCPHCDFKMGSCKWLDEAHTLVLQPRYTKRGSVVIVTECPACHEDSWIHEPWDMIESPASWRKVAEKLQAAEAAERKCDDMEKRG